MPARRSLSQGLDDSQVFLSKWRESEGSFPMMIGKWLRGWENGVTNHFQIACRQNVTAVISGIACHLSGKPIVEHSSREKSSDGRSEKWGCSTLRLVRKVA